MEESRLGPREEELKKLEEIYASREAELAQLEEQTQVR